MEYKELADARHLGALTYTDLSATDVFFKKPTLDAWGVMRVPFLPGLARMSAELTADGYDLDIKPWQNAGWEDCTFIVEDRILALDREDDSRMAALEGEWRRRRAKSLIQGSSPINDMLRAIRQLMVTDMGKCIVMTKAAPSGKAVVAISFIGTTEKYFDWFSNFKFKHNTGMHHGFLELARGFEAQSTRIMLPKLATLLGEETFTLADAVLEAKKEDSRISLWLSGHSQGGAIVQTYSHLLMSQGVLPERIHGYTFAAPSVAACDSGIEPKRYPIYNIVNTDDIVPRVGAQLRLGMDMIFYPTDAFRKRHYRVQEEEWELFSRALFAASKVQTTDEAVTWFVAFTRLARTLESKGDEKTLLEEMLPRVWLLKRVNLSVDEIADYVETKLCSQHETLTGEPVNEELCREYTESMQIMLWEYGTKPLSRVLMKTMGAPHRMRPDKHDDMFEPPYIAIVRRHLSECAQGVWMQDYPVRCLNAQSWKLLPMYRQDTRLLEEQKTSMLGSAANNTEQEEST